MSSLIDSVRFWLWERRIARMKRCHTLDELFSQHGSPHHKVRLGDIEMWHYPLRVIDGQLYSIHVSIFEDQMFQVYLHFEPAQHG